MQVYRDNSKSKGLPKLQIEPEKDASYYGDQADFKTTQGKYEEVIELYIKAIELDEDNPQYHFNISIGYNKLKQHGNALFHCLRTIEIDLENAEYHSNLGLTYVSLKRYDEAIIHILTAIDIEPCSAIYNYNLGYLYIKIKAFVKAIPYCQEAVSIEPGNAKYQNNLGKAYLGSKDFQKAADTFLDAMLLEEENDIYHFNLAEAYYKSYDYFKGKGNYYKAYQYFDKAIDQYNQAKSYAPDNSKYHAALGKACIKDNQFKQAVDSYIEAIKLDKHNASYHDYLSEAYFYLGQYEKAITSMQKAIKIDPSNAKYHYFLGLFYFDNKQFNNAFTLLEKAVNLDPKSSIFKLKFAHKLMDHVYAEHPVNEFQYVKSAMLCFAKSGGEGFEEIMQFCKRVINSPKSEQEIAKAVLPALQVITDGININADSDKSEFIKAIDAYNMLFEIEWRCEMWHEYIKEGKWNKYVWKKFIGFKNTINAILESITPLDVKMFEQTYLAKEINFEKG